MQRIGAIVLVVVLAPLALLIAACIMVATPIVWLIASIQGPIKQSRLRHPRLGELTSYASWNFWETKIHVPAFDAFAFRAEDDAPPSERRYRLFLPRGKRRGPPSDAAIALAARMLDESEKLVALVTDALWQRLQAEGPGSELWRHRLVTQSLADPEEFDTPIPDTPAGLLAMMRLDEIHIKDNPPDHDNLLVHLRIYVSFESEHHLEVVTNLDQVASIGYLGEPHAAAKA